MATSERAGVVEQVMAALTARDGDNGYQVTKGYLDERSVESSLDALRSIPVEQRMEAMGMRVVATVLSGATNQNIAWQVTDA